MTRRTVGPVGDDGSTDRAADGRAHVDFPAASPLWAALVARIVQAAGRKLGLLQPALYRAAATGEPPPGMRDITSGTNGSYSAGPGWDACTGLGVPDGATLLAALRESVGT